LKKEGRRVPSESLVCIERKVRLTGPWEEKSRSPLERILLGGKGEERGKGVTARSGILQNQIDVRRTQTKKEKRL